MKKLSDKAVELLLVEQRFSQTEFCKMHGLDLGNFCSRKNKGTLTIKTIELIYSMFDIEFNLMQELKALVKKELEGKNPTINIPKKLGITYNRAMYFVNGSKGSMQMIEQLYSFNPEAYEIINNYL